MDRILAPTDFSKNSEDAIFYATKLLANSNTTVVVVYSFEEAMSGLTSRVDIGKSEQVANQLYEKADKEGEEFIQRLKDRLGDDSVTFKFIATGMHVFRAVNRLIEKENIQLTVMGTKGRHADENILMGSTTAKMIKRIKSCPLLIVSENNQFQMPVKIGLATDFKDIFKAEHASVILETGQQCNAKLHLMHVGEEATLSDKQIEIKRQMEDILQPLDPKTNFISKGVQVSDMLHNFIEKEEIDFLVLLYRNHNPIAALFREPIIQRLSRNRTIPMLLMQTI